MSDYKTIIIDDEEPARILIKKYLQKFTNIEVIDECSNGFDGLKAIQTNNPDFIFLDIQMPKLTGFEMLELMDAPPEIIFSTAYDEFALKAFDLNAVDYLLKPYAQNRFDEAMEKLFLRLKTKVADKRVESSIDNLKSYIDTNTNRIERVVIRIGKQIKVITIDKIKYFEAQDDYVMLYSSDGNYLKEKTMKYFEDVLDPNEFVRIHRSYIVKLSEIVQLELYQKDTYLVVLKDGTKLKASRTGYRKLKELF